MRILFIVIAVVLFVVAIVFGNQKPFDQVVVSNSVAVTSNWVAGLSALGFALAGGLSLIAAAFVREKSEVANKA